MSALQLPLSKDHSVAMIALGDFRGDEKHPDMEVAIFSHDFEPGQPDSRLSGEADLGNWQVRIFKPACGCGVIVENEHLQFAEAGLQGFVGKACTFVRDRPSGGDYLLIVWRTTPRTINPNEISYIARCLGGLRAAFA